MLIGMYGAPNVTTVTNLGAIINIDETQYSMAIAIPSLAPWNHETI